MTQEKLWESEYARPTFLTTENKPQADTVRFVRSLKKSGALFDQSRVLDLGSGAGRNAFYLAELGARVVGFEISDTALSIARRNLSDNNLNIEYLKQSIGEKFPLPDSSVDIALDVTSSNSLLSAEREVCLSETHRVLRSGGYLFVKALCKDGDRNAAHLLKNFPGPEPDTYVLPKTGITERVFSKKDFEEIYQKFFTILHLEKKTSYTRMASPSGPRLFKRNFWIAYMRK